MDFILITILQFLTRPVPSVAFDLFIMFGWTIASWGILYIMLYFWVDEYKEPQVKADWNWKILAIDVPKENIQTPKAVEHMFAHLAGALETPNISMVYRHGFKQRKFSLEVISIEGYIQFLIRTEEELQDLVEAAVYAQYPEAEIVEVEDYVHDVPDKFPNETHQMWAGDFTLTEKDIYPIRTYSEFEHNTAEGEKFKDPMSSFLESFSKIGEGEQLWFQIILKPIADDWKKRGIREVKELIGEDTGEGGGVGTFITDFFMNIVEGFGDQIFGREASVESGSEDNGPVNKMQYLTPGQKNLVEGIENKISKIGFGVKMRGVYVARKEVFRSRRGVQALIGAVNQFNNPNSNSIKPTYHVDTSYLFAKRRESYRKNLLMYAYKNRKRKKGANPDVLNIEELATLWHFPMADVKTPLVQKSQEKKTEPPTGLPTENIMSSSMPKGISEEETQGEESPEEDQQKEKREFG